MGEGVIPRSKFVFLFFPVDSPTTPARRLFRLIDQECHIDLQKIARFAEVGLIHTEAVGLDLENRLVHCKDGRPPVRYDILSIDIGSTPKFVESKASGIGRLSAMHS